ncbi:MAG: heme exporter protein CcmD [Alphaproteobacteria bacterium]|nr:heme exporter protein CcmD [Alphaproteobacteria bacterium]
MGPFAVYIWSSYAVAAAVLIGLLVQTALKVRADQAKVDRLEEAVAQMRQTGGADHADET